MGVGLEIRSCLIDPEGLEDSVPGVLVDFVCCWIFLTVRSISAAVRLIFDGGYRSILQI